MRTLPPIDDAPDLARDLHEAEYAWAALNRKARWAAEMHGEALDMSDEEAAARDEGGAVLLAWLEATVAEWRDLLDRSDG